MTEETKEKQNLYELAYLLDPAIPEEGLGGSVDTLRGILDAKGVKVVVSEMPALRGLAYTISIAEGGKRAKYDRAYFGFMRFDGTTEVADALGSELKKNKEIVRFMLIHAPKGTVPARAPRVAPGFRGVKNEQLPKEKPSEEEIDKQVDELIASTL